MPHSPDADNGIIPGEYDSLQAALAATPICLDARALPEGTGVASYEAAARVALATVGLQAGRLTEGAAIGARLARWLSAAWPGARRIMQGSDGALAGRDIFRIAQIHFDIFGRPLRLRAAGEPGVIHWSYPLPLRLDGWINVYTIHDAIPLTRPELTPIDPRRHRRLLASIVGSADAIVTVSEAARLDIAAALAIEPSRIINCGAAVNVPAAIDVAPHADHLLVCGAVEPRKNLVRLVAAHAKSGVANPLLIVGPDGWRADAIRARIGTAPNVEWRRYASRVELLGLIGSARALLMPSLAEGFGLPVAEAMMLGTPVLTSHDGALAETAGGTALLVDPLDIDAIAAGIRALSTDDGLADRLRRAGPARAAAFAARPFGERLAAVYARCIASRDRPDYRRG